MQFVRNWKMKRFVIRNYGPSRQIPYKDQNICLSNDQCIESNDEELVAFLKSDEEFKTLHVSDRGSELAHCSSHEAEETAVAVIDEAAEISYDDMTVPELKALCAYRDIKTSKLLKGELIEALEAYEVENAEDEELEGTVDPEDPDPEPLDLEDDDLD
jgi:hypothetical protein